MHGTPLNSAASISSHSTQSHWCNMTDTTKLKTKKKKPKHLKRKIAQATDEAAKETLRQSLNDFERRKQDFLESAAKQQQKQTHKDHNHQSKKQKTEGIGRSKMTASTITDTSTNNDQPTATTSSLDSNLKSNQCGNPKPDQSSKVASNNQEKEASHSRDSKNDDDSSVDEPTETAKRQRGRRRRGRKDTSQKVVDEQQQEVAVTKMNDLLSSSNNTAPASSSRKDKPPKDMSRYCIGRKPINDFVVGQTYSGTVKYAKSFGIFIDINCHSDAFCHVSFLSDNYVEDPASLYKQGDTVEARVVDIDRPRKRITVSMQSESMKEMEQKSIDSRKEHEEKTAPAPKKRPPRQQLTTEATQHAERPMDAPKALAHKVTHASGSFSSHQRPASHQSHAAKSPAELKRERKLARRAERRAQKEQEDTVGSGGKA